MAINLTNLNISLDAFNKEASGVMNIGQMKLSSDGKSIYRTNKHETLTILNRTKISSEEALAVKFAFCKALSKEGLSQDAIDAVKAKLGISGNAITALKAGNIKPLTAAEVREVIDEYAGQINDKRASAANGAKALKTSREIYRGVGAEELAARATKRNEINEKSINKLMTGADKAVNNLLDMLQFGEKGATITLANKAFAREVMTKLGNPGAFNGKNGKAKPVDMVSATVKFKLQDNGKVLAEFTLNNKNRFAIDTGLTREGLADKAVELLNADAASRPPKVEKPRVARRFEDDDIMNAINEIESGGIEPARDKGGVSNEVLIRGLKDVFSALKEARNQDERKALRDANMEEVVVALQKALDNARRLDNRNTEIINNVREVFYGNKNIDTENLLKTITDVVNKKPVSNAAKVDENIRNKVDDDLDSNLNINDWLGAD